MSDEIPEVEEQFESESDTNCDKSGTELDLSVIEWEWVETEARFEQNGFIAEPTNPLKAMNLKQFIVFVSIAFLAIASSLAAAKVVPIFANKLVPVPIPEPVDEAEFGGWKYLSFMTPSLDLVTKVSESMEIPHRVNYVKEKISSAVPPTITKRFEEFKGSKEFSTVYEFCADFTTAANGMVSSSLTRFQNSRDTVLTSKAYQGVMAKSKAVLQGCESHLSKFSAIAASKIQSTSTGFSEMVQSTHMYHAIKEKIKKVTSTDDAKNGWFVWFKARKDPCQKWLGKDWFDKAFYRFCTAWKKSSVWELIWPEPKRSKVCDSAFCW